MSLLAVGLSHRTAETGLLERVALPGDDLPKVLHELVEAEHVEEAMVLSTCNRLEVYASTATFHGGVTEVCELIARASGVPLADLADHLYVHHDARAVAHAFSVAAGLDSMLVGESQILGQLRASLRLAEQEGTLGRSLGELARHALRVGKRARSETGIDRAGASVVGVGIRIAEQRLGGLTDRRVLVVGAGSTGALAAHAAVGAGAQVTVLNRSRERAERLAAAAGARAGALTDLAEALRHADLVISSTGAAGLVVSAALVGDRSRNPVFLLDLALPRDVDPAAARLPGVTLVDLDVLRGAAESSAAAVDVESVRAIVAEEVQAHLAWQQATTVAPTVVALRSKAEDLVRSELLRLSGRLPDLDAHARREVESTVHRVVEKLLHTPTVRVKQLAGSPGGDVYAGALRELFGLDPTVVAAVSEPHVSAVDPSGDAP